MAAALLAVAALVGCRWPWQRPPAPHALELPGTVDARLAVDEGEPVHGGQLLAEIDPADFVLAVRRADAQAQSARQVLAAMRAGARPQELRAAEAAVAQAQADAQFAAAEVGRTQQLVAQRFVAPQQMERASSVADAARGRLQQARESLALLRAGALKEDIERAEADVRAATAALETARRQLAYVGMSSPVAGVVSVRLAEAGQVVGAGQPVLRLAELSRPWVRIYLAAADLPRVQLNQAVQVRVEGLPDKVFTGRLSFISPQAEFTPKTVETKALRVDLVYRAKVDVDNPQGLLKIGMPADVTLPSPREPA